MKEYKTTIPEIELKYKRGDVLSRKIISSKDSYEILMKFYDEDVFELTESFLVLFLNGANKCIGWMKNSTGGINFTVCEPRTIYATALKSGATSIIVSHNHPSGQLYPSSKDEDMTKKLKEGSRYLGISLLDHIIATSDGYYSFADEGKL